MENKELVWVKTIGIFLVIYTLILLLNIPFARRMGGMFRPGISESYKMEMLNRIESEKKIVNTVMRFNFVWLINCVIVFIGSIGVMMRKYKLALFALIGTFLALVLSVPLVIFCRNLIGYTPLNLITAYPIFFIIFMSTVFIGVTIVLTRPKVKEQFK